MATYPHSVVLDTAGGRIPFPPFVSQDTLNSLKRDFDPSKDHVFVITYPRSGTTWTEQIVRLLAEQDNTTHERLTDIVPWLETLPNRPGGLKFHLDKQKSPCESKPFDHFLSRLIPIDGDPKDL